MREGLENVVEEITVGLQGVLTNDQFTVVKNVIYITLKDYNVEKKVTDIAIREEDIDNTAYSMFFVSKKVEGKSDRTIGYYKYVIDRFLRTANINITEISSKDIKCYLAIRQMKDGVSNITCDNERRVISSLCSFLVAEEYISKDPSKRIKKIKTMKVVKKPYTGTELENMREHSGSLRNKAIIDTLYSTGCRVGEIVKINKSDIHGDEVIVTGKGNKQRTVYLTERALYSLNEYFKSRNDSNEALFVSSKAPHERIGISQIENIIRQIGRKCGIEKSHPHKFRRTNAQTALNRGMPLEEVKEMLGHESVDTTLIYAQAAVDNIKADHKKYVA